MAPDSSEAGPVAQTRLSELPADARSLCKGALSASEPPGTAPELLAEAGRRQLSGDWAAAGILCRRVLEKEPGNAEAHYRLGLLEMQRGSWEPALAWIEKATALAPSAARYGFGLGQALAALGRQAEASEAFRKVLRAEPGLADVHHALGQSLQIQGELAAAAQAYAEAVRLRPEFPQALNNLGVVLCGLRRFAEAAEVLERAARLDPVLPQAAFNLGNALRGLGRDEEALASYREAVALKPDYAEALNNLGTLCRERGDFSGALDAFSRAMEADPRSPAAFSNAGGLYRRLGRMAQAQQALEHALSLDPSSAAALGNLGNVLKEGGDMGRAMTCFRRAVEADPADPVAHGNLLYCLTFEAEEPRVILEEARRWDARHAVPLRSAVQGHANDRSPERRLRVGYVSADFREHCQSLFTLPLFAHHDRRAVEVYCYSSVERPDGCTDKLRSSADAWREVRRLDDAELAEALRRDRIDVAVDIEMHMAGGRPLLFARRPAPVQVAWLAYPATSGVGAMDAVLSDPRLAPVGAEADYIEPVVRLPDTFWCYGPGTEGPAVGPLPAAGGGPLTLGCLNSPCKITRRTLAMWGEVLRTLEDSRLLLLAPPGPYRNELMEALAVQGVAPDRIEIQPFKPRDEYLRTYHRIDLALDTFPYNGHTTSLDALWMGVPVVSRVGRTAVGRAGLSQLANLGLPELAADSDRAFVETAVGLARDLPRLEALRRELRPRMERSALMDAPRFARAIERAYRELWRSWCSNAAAPRP